MRNQNLFAIMLLACAVLAIPEEVLSSTSDNYQSLSTSEWSGLRPDAVNHDLLSSVFAVSGTTSFEAQAQKTTWALRKLRRSGPSDPSQILMSTLGNSVIQDSLCTYASVSNQEGYSAVTFWVLILATLSIAALTVKGNSKGTICLLICLGSLFSSCARACATGSVLAPIVGDENHCEPCPAGTYQLGDYCYPCKLNTYQTAPGTDACINCPSGQIQLEVGKTECVAYVPSTGCPDNPGQINPGSGCGPCDPGFYQTGNTCELCPDDSIQGSSGSTTCTQCDYDETSNGGDLTCGSRTCNVGLVDNGDGGCELCPAGKYEHLGLCVDCPAGTYRGMLNILMCLSCPVGMESNADKTGCEYICDAGSVYNVGTKDCDDCLAGYYQSENSCLACTGSQYQNEAGKAECIDCPGGSTVNNEHTTCVCTPGNNYNLDTKVCDACEVGTHQSGNTCVSCGANEVAVAGSASCTACGEGKEPNDEKSACESLCDADKYYDSDDSACASCPSKQKPNNDQTDCVDTCTADSIIDPIEGGDQYHCTKCPDGQEPNADQDECVSVCEANEKYVPSGIEDVAGTCIACPTAQVPNADHSSCERICEAGYIFYPTNQDAEHCEQCPPGTYRSEELCRACPLNTHQSEPGKESCDNCEAGEIQLKTGQTECVAHVASEDCSGTLGSVRVSGGEGYTCTGCETGTYESRDDCLACPAGSYQYDTFAITCATCPLGTDPGLAECEARDKCTNDYYWNDGAASCELCPAGKYEFLTNCLDCPEGTYRNILSIAPCLPCEFGYESNEAKDGCTRICDDGEIYAETETAGEYACKNCAKGTYQSGEECLDCASGTYQNEDGKTACNTCSAALKPNEDKTDCERICQSGEAYNSGTSTCDICQKGQYQDGEECKTCQGGQYQNQAAQTTCKTCPFGQAPTENQEDCERTCEDGAVFYPTNEDANNCEDCPPGTYQSGELCKACEMNFHQPSTGQISCIACGAGEVQLLEGQRVCTEHASPENCGDGLTDESGSCVACEAGKYQAADACEACPINSDSVESSISCTSCPEDKYRSDPSVAACASRDHCNKGLIYNDASGECEYCPRGKYELAQNCQACPDGTYRDILAILPCVPCGFGDTHNVDHTGCERACDNGEIYTKISAGGATPVIYGCIKCSTGTHQYENDCVACEAGKFQNEEGMTECKACDFGDTPTGDKDDCERICDAGSIYKQTDIVEDAPVYSCVKCEKGTYQVDNTCETCEAGKYQSDEGQATCDTCVFSKEPTEDQTDCQRICVAGKIYRQVAGTGTDESNPALYECVDCEAGTYEVSNDCTTCPNGEYQNEVGKTACKTCGYGKSPNNFQTDCVRDCQTGSAYNGASCDLCTAGHYQLEETCAICPANTYQKNDGATTCGACSVGKKPNPAQTDCISVCNAGSIFVVDNTGLDGICTACIAGEFQEGEVCTTCPDGQYQSSPGSTSCDACPAGKVSNADHDGCVKPCPNGQFYDDSQVTGQKCQPCAKGTHEIDGTCTPCAIGTVQPNTGATTCNACSAGEIQPETGKEVCYTPTCNAGYVYDITSPATSYCVACPAGKHWVSGACVDCVAGTYQNLVAQTTCAKCPKGSVSAAVGATSSDTCTTCPSGEYQSEVGKTSCDACPIKTFQSGTDHTKCVDCPVGTSNNQIRKTQCTPCSPGSANNLLKQSSCKSCDPNTYQKDPGQATCLACPTNYIQPSSGETSCINTICSDGYVFNIHSNNNDYCDPCPVGSHKSGKQCVPCETGTYQNHIASSKCKDCSEGYYQNLEGQTECKPCKVGTAQDAKGKAKCSDCEEGYYQDSPAREHCQKCDVGHYSNEKASTSCKKCAIGSYQDTKGQSECKLCEPGNYQDKKGQASCKLCIPGEVQPLMGEDHCDVCPISQYQSNPGRAECRQCPEDQYTSAVGSIECQACPPGSYPDSYQSRCLYKGLFNSKNEFEDSKFKTDCFDHTGALIKPFTHKCRTAYRELCCQGSYTKPTANCNFALELINSNLKDNYCSACPFMDWSACPADGICWNDETWIINNQDPYFNTVSDDCYRAIAPYCIPKLAINPASVECQKLGKNCNGGISGSAYGGNWNKFKISFTNIMNADTSSCNNFLDDRSNPAFTSGPSKCVHVKTPRSVDVFVDKLNAPILEYMTKPGAICDPCGRCLPAMRQKVAPPYPALETATLTTNLDNTCNFLSVSVNVVVYFILVNHFFIETISLEYRSQRMGTLV